MSDEGAEAGPRGAPRSWGDLPRALYRAREQCITVTLFGYGNTVRLGLQRGRHRTSVLLPDPFDSELIEMVLSHALRRLAKRDEAREQHGEATLTPTMNES